MTTADKRAYIQEHCPTLFAAALSMIQNGGWRELDTLVLELDPPAHCLGYIITLLCDELTVRDNEDDNEGEDVIAHTTTSVHTAMINYMNILRNASLRITRDHFIETFGDTRGSHIYKKFMKCDQNLNLLFRDLDSSNQTLLISLIQTIGT